MSSASIIPYSKVEEERETAKKISKSIHDECLRQDSYLPIASTILKLDNAPYSLRNYFHFYPMFDRNVPARSTWMCARQMAKSMTSAATAITLSVALPGLSFVVMNPLFETAKRFSSLRLQPLLQESPVYDELFDKHSGASNSVLQKVFSNGSSIYLSYAWLNLVRTRGLSADILFYDEMQNFNPEFEPVINRILDESDLRILAYCGTPLSSENVLAHKFMKFSSAAELGIRCGCGKWNIPHTEYHLLKMIGPEGPICWKCGSDLNVRKAVWVDRYPSRKEEHRGFHVPRIMSIKTASSKRRWNELLFDITNLPKFIVYNEIFGEPFDLGIKPITRAELEAACILDNLKNDFEDVKRLAGSYKKIAMGVDWSGGGQSGVSRTAVAFAGLKVNGLIDVIFGRIAPPTDPVQECYTLVRLFQQSSAQIFAHDTAVAGMVRHSVLRSLRLPNNQIMPLSYEPNRPGRDLVTFRQASGDRVISYYGANKARSIATVLSLIKNKQIRFPNVKYMEPAISDFLTLLEEWTQPRDGSEVYYISKEVEGSDDFVHAVTFACLACWHAANKFPTVDVDPNYFIDEDLWGVVHDGKTPGLDLFLGT